MPTAWRIVKERYASTAFDGMGARRVGGRFNSRGVGMVYAADSLALAILEVLVHLSSYRGLRERVALRIAFDDALVETLDEADLPADWRATPAGRSSQRVGDVWISEQRSPVLRVPSVVVPQEYNYLLNPEHPDFDRISFGEAEPVRFDPRLEK